MFGQFFIPDLEKNDFSARIDPRVKIALLILFFIAILLIAPGQIVKLMVCAGIILLLLIILPLKPARLFTSVVKIYPMIFVISLFQLVNSGLITEGKTFFQILSGSPEIWGMIALFQTKTILIIAAGFVFISITPFTRLIAGLNKMHLPGPFVSVVFFVYHFLFILGRELNRIHTAIRSRFVKLSLIKRTILIRNVMIMYFMRLFDKTERLNHLLLSRGFGGVFYFRVSLVWQRTDTIVLTAGIGLFLLINFIG